MFKKLLIMTMLITSLFGGVRELTDENFEKATKRGMVVVEFYASWNKANMVTLLDEWDNFEVNRVCRLDVEKYDKIMTSQNVVVLPTIIFYLDGDEAGRLQGNMKFQLETTIKELDKKVEEIYNEDKFN
jgi:thiol:disulfide interchange protein